jgi:hypothetical protein
MNAVELFAFLFGNVMQRMFHTNKGKSVYYKLSIIIKHPIVEICSLLNKTIKEMSGTTEFEFEGASVVI